MLCALCKSCAVRHIQFIFTSKRLTFFQIFYFRFYDENNREYPHVIYQNVAYDLNNKFRLSPEEFLPFYSYSSMANITGANVRLLSCMAAYGKIRQKLRVAGKVLNLLSTNQIAPN